MQRPRDRPIGLAASDELKKEYLGRLSEAPLLASFCLTEPDAGSDVSGMKTTATRGDKWVINGSKCFITNGEYANYYTVYAKTDKEAGHRGISCFIVPRDAGVVVDKHEDKMGQRASNTATITFPEVEIPLDHLVGEENKGFKIAMMTLDRTRPGVAAMATGVARAAMEFAIDYSKERVQFGVPIAMHQAIQFMIADMATKVHMAAWRPGTRPRCLTRASATRSSPHTPSASRPTPRWRSRPTQCRSSAATASSRSTRSRS